MRPLSAWGASLLSVVALKFAVGCSSNSAAPNAESPVDAGAIDAASSSKIAAQSFEEFAPWASPIDDYLAVGRKHQPGKFNASINELMAAGDRLFFGYGDADYNLGEKIPIEMRAFRSADDPASVEAIVVLGDGQGAPQKTTRQSGEEQIDRYRMLDGELWQAGIDSTDPDELWTQENTTPKGIQGNVYRLEGETFKKHRTVNGGEHVHDLAPGRARFVLEGSRRRGVGRFVRRLHDLDSRFGYATRTAGFTAHGRRRDSRALGSDGRRRAHATPEVSGPRVDTGQYARGGATPVSTNIHMGDSRDGFGSDWRCVMG